MVVPPKEVLASIQIRMPAGAAMAAARPNTNSVRSRIDRTIIFLTCGGRNGGISSVNEEGTPFRTVADNSLVIARVVKIPRTMVAVRRRVDKTDALKPVAAPTKNIVIIEISVGKAQQSYGKKILIFSFSKTGLIPILLIISFFSLVVRSN